MKPPIATTIRGVTPVSVTTWHESHSSFIFYRKAVEDEISPRIVPMRMHVSLKAYNSIAMIEGEKPMWNEG